MNQATSLFVICVFVIQRNKELFVVRCVLLASAIILLLLFVSRFLQVINETSDIHS
jgi:hypothetical protein